MHLHAADCLCSSPYSTYLLVSPVRVRLILHFAGFPQVGGSGIHPAIASRYVFEVTHIWRLFLIGRPRTVSLLLPGTIAASLTRTEIAHTPLALHVSLVVLASCMPVLSAKGGTLNRKEPVLVYCLYWAQSNRSLERWMLLGCCTLHHWRA